VSGWVAFNAPLDTVYVISGGGAWVNCQRRSVLSVGDYCRRAC